MSEHNQPHLIRGMGLLSATAANMLEMIGIGPFITIPLIIAAMGGRKRCLDGCSARSSPSRRPSLGWLRSDAWIRWFYRHCNKLSARLV